MARPDDGRICVGVIKGTRGLKGELRIKPYTDEPESIAAYGPVETEDGTHSLTLSRIKVSGAAVLAHAKEVGTREAAEALIGQNLYVDRNSLPAANDDEFYHADLIGLAVEDMKGQALGTIVAIQNFGVQDLLEVKLERARETALIPFTPEIVPTVDINSGKVVIDPPEGLLVLAPETGQDKRKRKKRR